MFSIHSKLYFLSCVLVILVAAITISTTSTTSSLVDARPSLGSKKNSNNAQQKHSNVQEPVLGSNEELSSQRRNEKKNRSKVMSTGDDDESSRKTTAVEQDDGVTQKNSKVKSSSSEQQAEIKQQPTKEIDVENKKAQSEVKEVEQPKQHEKNLPLNHPDMAQFHPDHHGDAAFQSDSIPKMEKLSSDEKSSAMNEIVSAQKEKRELERKRHPAASQQYVELHGQRVSVASLQTMCKHLAIDHLPFLKIRSGRELEIAILFAANRLMSVFDGHVFDKRIPNGVDGISCPHGVAISQSAEATKLYDLISEAQRELEGIRLHLLDLADAWTITQSKDSDLVEEVVASLGYYSTLARVGNTVLLKIAFLKNGGAITTHKDGEEKCLKMVREFAAAVKDIPDGVPNWTHMKVGAEMLTIQCDMEPSLQTGDL